MNLKEYAQKNGGFTLNKEGELFKKKEGFVVSFKKWEFTTEDLDEALENIEEKLKIIKRLNKKNLLVGLWYEEGLWYADINNYITDKEKALKFGFYNKQIGIYDLAKNNTIKIRYKKTYTIYNKNMEVVTQFDSIKEVNKFLKVKGVEVEENSLRRSITRRSLIDKVYYIIKDLYYYKEDFI